MNKIKIGLIGYGTVGSGVVKLLHKKRKFFKDKFQLEFTIEAVCDLQLKDNSPKILEGVSLTTDYKSVVTNPGIDVIIELIGGIHPAREIALEALANGKHFVTANKGLIASHGQELFAEAQKKERNIYFETSVMAGVPVIKTITEGLAGNQINGLFGIINGTCNYILSEMSSKKYNFADAVAEAQRNGFAETDPTLDINGMDSAYKLAILVSLAFDKFIKVKDIHTEGITHISHSDIEYADSLGLCIKLLAIAKKVNNEIEARVHPTLINKNHPLASINGVRNALFVDADALGNLLVAGDGAGQMTAASGVLSDLVNLATRQDAGQGNLIANFARENPEIHVRSIDEILTKFYIRFMATDKPGVLSQIAGILGEHDIGINSVFQKAHNRAATVPVVMLTDYAPEKMVRVALDIIHKLPIVKAKPVAIRMEDLK